MFFLSYKDTYFSVILFYAGSGAPAAIITILLPELTVILPVPVATLICSDTTDLRLLNNPFGQVSNTNVPTLTGSNPAQIAQNEFAKAMFEFAVGWKRDFARLLYTGTPTNNTAGGGYKEFWGFDALINTGYRDAETGTACPALLS